MKKSNIATLIVFLALIPLTLFLGDKLPGRGYYITGVLIITELAVPFFMMFEKRKPQARELVVLAVMIALAVIGRVAIPIPHFKAVPSLNLRIFSPHRLFLPPFLFLNIFYPL